MIILHAYVNAYYQIECILIVPDPFVNLSKHEYTFYILFVSIQRDYFVPCTRLLKCDN